ncbi:MAG: 4Fe-4S dicluster domain-containing protein [Epsilonproteobacteria bacterium]|nr:4Fe-4S dicluster domain-containing protein [Campylobacterota bacterium]
MSEYIQKGELFSFNLLKCLRTSYFHNNCQECLEICPKEAFFFDRRKLTLDFEKCTNCSICLGVCPTEALELTFFDPNEFVISEGKEIRISCKKNVPCLSGFSSLHFASLLLRKERVFIDLSHCQECELNPDNRILTSIQERVKEANRFVKELGVEKEIEEFEEPPSRRNFFKAIFKATKTLLQEESFKKSGVNKTPFKWQLLKNSIKLNFSSLPNKTVSTSFSFLAKKRIENSCTNCGDCVQFCPTDALFYNQQGDSIFFTAGACIDCNICNDICKSNSINDEEKIDIIAWAFDREERLIKHQLEICQECKTPFPYVEGEKICSRCKEFLEDFKDIFKLANEEPLD